MTQTIPLTPISLLQIVTLKVFLRGYRVGTLPLPRKTYEEIEDYRPRLYCLRREILETRSGGTSDTTKKSNLDKDVGHDSRSRRCGYLPSGYWDWTLWVERGVSGLQVDVKREKSLSVWEPNPTSSRGSEV